MKHAAIVKMARLLQSLETEAALYHLLKTPAHQFELLQSNPPYLVFTVPKKSGGNRTIEDPSDELQKIQAVLKKYLQALYYCYSTDAAFGYVQKASDKLEKRGIYENALLHKNAAYLINIDLEDFFHFVGWQKMYAGITDAPFSIHPVVAKAICNICSFQGRLPMGAPTSPALSNIAAYEIDREIGSYCKMRNILYSRYVDDMSFSSASPIGEKEVEEINGLVTTLGYEINRKKLKIFKPGDTKMITGLELKNGWVRVPAVYFAEVQQEIEHLRSFVLMQARLYPGKSMETQLVKPLQRINGALLFIENVNGDKDTQLIQLQQLLQTAVLPPSDFESLNWLRIGYEVF